MDKVVFLWMLMLILHCAHRKWLEHVLCVVVSACYETVVNIGVIL